MSHLTISQRRALWAYAFLLIPLAFFVYFRIGPTLSAFNVSLHDWNPLAQEQPYVGTANY